MDGRLPLQEQWGSISCVSNSRSANHELESYFHPRVEHGMIMDLFPRDILQTGYQGRESVWER